MVSEGDGNTADGTTDEETITVADTVPDEAGESVPVELPVVEVLTGRSFLTGKSGAGKSNTASVVIERLLDSGYPVLVVDIDGEYYGLKETYEVLHVGADEECDIQVGPEHAERIAALALEQNVPIVLDVSGFLEEESRELLTAVARQLFAKEKKLKKPFLLVVEEVHEYIPEGGGLDECGRMLIKVGKRGRKHGLGIVGISQRPADVKKDFITQCDWLVWHRLTWNNDTRVVKRVLDTEHADAVEKLDDGEAFLTTDWSGTRRVQFRRKETFDAGATPGLDDVERPDLKSVSDDLVSELAAISDRQSRRDDELERLQDTLERKERRIRELEEELARAREMSEVADRFAEALTDHDGAGAERDTDGASDAGDGDDAPSADDGPSADATENAVSFPTPSTTPDTQNDSNGAGGSAGIEDSNPSDMERPIVDDLRGRIDGLDDIARRMLARYRDAGPTTPVDAHVAAGGSGERALAYARNRELRERDLVRHAGRGQYAYALAALVDEAHDGRLPDPELADIVDTVETGLLPVAIEE